MEENMFIQAMDVNEVEKINRIKENKEFAISLITDLSRVFQTNHKIESDKEYVIIRMKTSPSYNWYRSFSFIARDSGVVFSSEILTYNRYTNTLFSKYKDVAGTKRDRDNSDFCNTTIKISMQKTDLNLADKLKDIVELMNLGGYYKKF